MLFISVESWVDKYNKLSSSSSSLRGRLVLALGCKIEKVSCLLKTSYSVLTTVSFSTLSPKIGVVSTEGKDLTGSFTIKETISYLEIPLNIITYYKLGSGKLFFGTGLYVGFALGGTVKSDAEGGLMALFQPLGLLTTKDLTFGSGKDFKSIDCGMNYLLGYELKNGFGIHAGGGIGLVNTNGAFGDKAKTHNMSLYTGLQYSF